MLMLRTFVILIIAILSWGCCDCPPGDSDAAKAGNGDVSVEREAKSESSTLAAKASETKPNAAATPEPLGSQRAGDGEIPEVSSTNRVTLPIKVAKPFKDQYPLSNDWNQVRLATEFHQPGILQFEIPSGATPTPVVWRVMGPVKNFLLQSEDQPAVGDLPGLIAHLTKDAKTEREKAEKLFFFVRDVVTDWWYPAERGDLTVPDLKSLIWNYGYGYCYDLGRLQAGLWAEAGLRSRIVGWPQHTVAEVYYDDAWHLYDLQHHTFYENADGSVASFAQLKSDPTLFYQNLNAFGLDAIGYPPHHMAHWYSIAHPNFQDSEDGDHWQAERDFRLSLRAGEMLEILWSEPGTAYHPDSWVVYYGMKTKRKDPPYTVQGRLTYGSKHYKEDWRMVWRKVKTPDKTPGYAVTMSLPFLFTEGYMDIPAGALHSKGWVKTRNDKIEPIEIKHGKADLTARIAGTNQFELIVEADPEAKTYQEAKLDLAMIQLGVQFSPIGLPALKPGTNRIPFQFEEGKVYYSLWYKEHAPSLSIQNFRAVPENPKPGEDVNLVYTVTNSGSGRSQPTSLTLFNNVTSFLSETTEKLGVQTVPPLKPGESADVTFYWKANTRMTWYGQNPYVQLMDAWLDIEKDTPTHNRMNMREQNYIFLHKEDGTVPKLPGYSKLH